MGTRQNKVERRRLRRKNKRRESQVFSARRALQKLGDTCPIHACMVNRDWREDGKASILFARSVAPGRVTLAAFLVDTWAMGLKDAWGRTDIARSEFDELVSRQREAMGACPLNVGLAKHLVYGGIELSRELGFRLPRKYERWTAVLGPLSEGESPDMGLFRADGKIRLICSERDFRARLIGTTPEIFLNRSDVEFCLGDDGFSLLDDEPEPVDEAIVMLEQAMVERARQWCFANGQQPHALLPDVVSATLMAMTQGLPQDLDLEGDVETLPDGHEDAMGEQIAGFLSASFQHDKAGSKEALHQVLSFMASTDSPEQFLRELNLAE